MILKQEFKARSSVFAGLITASLCILPCLVLGEIDWVTMVLIPAMFGLSAWLVRVLWLSFARQRRLRKLGELFTPVEPGSPEWAWFERAWLATTRLDRLARRALPEPFVGRLRDEVTATARSLYDLAGHTSELKRRIAVIDGSRLADEAAQLPDPGQADVSVARARAALSDMSAVLNRLSAARETALARLAADTYVLESLHARVLELEVSPTAFRSPPQTLDNLVLELEGLRQGISEATANSQRALGVNS